MGKAKPLEPLTAEQKALAEELAGSGEAIAQKTRQTVLAMLQRCLDQCRACQDERDQLREQVRQLRQLQAGVSQSGDIP